MLFTMKGKPTFTKQQAEHIRYLLREKVRSGNLKVWRDKLRANGFYISNYSRPASGFTSDDFDRLVQSGHIVVS